MTASLGMVVWLCLSTGPTTSPVVSTVTVAAKKKKKPKAPPKTSSSKVEPKKTEGTSMGLDLTDSANLPPPPPPVLVEADSPPAEAPPPPEPVSAVSLFARTTAISKNLIEAGAGWPGVYFGYTRGILARLDVGGRIGFNYGYEGQVTTVAPGLRFQLRARYLIWEKGEWSIVSEIAPGVLVYFLGARGTLAGLTVPLSATLGLPQFINRLSLSATLEVPIWGMFDVGAVVSIFAGANAEYALNDSWRVFAKLKPLGVAIWTNGAGAFYAFEALVGAALIL